MQLVRVEFRINIIRLTKKSIDRCNRHPGIDDEEIRTCPSRMFLETRMINILTVKMTESILQRSENGKTISATILTRRVKFAFASSAVQHSD